MGTIKSNCKEYYALSSIRAQDVMVGTMSTCPLGCSAKAATLRSIFDCVAGLIVLGEPVTGNQTGRVSGLRTIVFN
jgi:hypothetical protein